MGDGRLDGVPDHEDNGPVDTRMSWTSRCETALALVRELFPPWAAKVAQDWADRVEALRGKHARTGDPNLEAELREIENLDTVAPPGRVVNLLADPKEFDAFLGRIWDEWSQSPAAAGPGFGSRTSSDFVALVALALIAIDERQPGLPVPPGLWPPPQKLTDVKAMLRELEDRWRAQQQAACKRDHNAERRQQHQAAAEVSLEEQFRGVRHGPEAALGGGGKRPSQAVTKLCRPGGTHQDAIPYLRIGELLLVYLLRSGVRLTKPGLADDPAGGAAPGTGWGPRMPQARLKVTHYICESVARCLARIAYHEPRFPPETDSVQFAGILMDWWLGENGGCSCVRGAKQRHKARQLRQEYLRLLYETCPSAEDRKRLLPDDRRPLNEAAKAFLGKGGKKAGGRGQGNQQQGELRRNIREKMIACGYHHRLFAWLPAYRTLWEALQIFVKGTYGSLKDVGIDSGALRQILWEIYPLLTLAEVVKHHCPRCGCQTVVESQCTRCHHTLADFEVRRTDARYWLLLDDPVETDSGRLRYEELPFFVCKGPAVEMSGPALRSFVNGQIRQKEIRDWRRLVEVLLSGRTPGKGPDAAAKALLWRLLPDDLRSSLETAAGQPPSKGLPKEEILAALNTVLRKAKLWQEQALEPGKVGGQVGCAVRNVRNAFAKTPSGWQMPDEPSMNRVILEALLGEWIKPSRCANLYPKRLLASKGEPQACCLEGCEHPTHLGQRAAWRCVYRWGPLPDMIYLPDEMLEFHPAPEDDDTSSPSP
jgi:hypothetical protein